MKDEDPPLGSESGLVDAGRVEGRGASGAMVGPVDALT